MSNKSLMGRARAALKGLLWGSDVTPSPWSFAITRPGTIDYAGEVGDLDLLLSRVVMAYVNFMGGAFPQARFQVQRRDGTVRLTEIPDHRLTQLLTTPNPDYAGLLLI